MVGALVPALLTELLARGRTRPAVALLLATIAVALTYVTVTTTNVVTQSPPTFPVPAAVRIATVPPPTTVPQPNGAYGEAVPSEVSCTSDGCSDSVTLRNLGNVPIEVRDIEIVPDPNNFNLDHACDYQTLQPGAECSFEVSYSPSAPLEQAQLVIHQDLPGAPWYVNLRGQGPTTPTTQPAPTTPTRSPTPTPPTSATPPTPGALPTIGDTDEAPSTP